MSVTPRGGSYQVAFSFGGRRFRKQFTTEGEALQWEADARAALLRGDEPIDAARDEGGITLQEALRRTYLRYWVGSKSEKSLMMNGRMVVNAIGGDRNVRSITAADLDCLIDHYRYHRNSNSTINRKLAALSRILKTAERYDEGFRMPRIEKLREPEGRTKVFTDAEINQMCRIARHIGKPWLAEMIVIGADTGLRLGEIVKLEEQDISVDRDDHETLWVTVRESKSGKSRQVPCTNRVAALFVEGWTPYPDKSAVSRAWDQVRVHMDKHDDKDWVFHTLRHTFCSNLVRRGVDVLTVARLAGHSSVQVTMRYAKLAPNNLTDAIGVLN